MKKKKQREKKKENGASYVHVKFTKQTTEKKKTVICGVIYKRTYVLTSLIVTKTNSNALCLLHIRMAVA